MKEPPSRTILSDIGLFNIFIIFHRIPYHLFLWSLGLFSMAKIVLFFTRCSFIPNYLTKITHSFSVKINHLYSCD